MPTVCRNVARFRSTYSSAETGMSTRSWEGKLPRTDTSRLSSPHPSERSNTAWTTLKMAVVAPMPSASAATAAAVKPGVRSSPRTANLRSRSSVSMISLRSQGRHRIDPRGAQRRDAAGGDGNEPEDRGDHRVREGIPGADSVELGSDQLRSGKRGDGPDA